MKKIKILLSITILFMIFGCCPTDYTKDIKKIMNPFSKGLTDFFAENGEYPTSEQRDKILENAGCKIVDSNNKICKFKGQSFTYESNLELSRKLYFFAIAKKGSHCYLDMSPDGKIVDKKCIKDSCINIDP